MNSSIPNVLSPQTPSPRQRISFNHNWRFQKGDLPASLQPDFDDTAWRQLKLPHDWGIEGPFQQELPGETGKLPWAGVAWYRKRFTVAAGEAGQCWVLEIDGAMSHSTVWLNGQHVGGWAYGYSSYQLDLTPYIVAERENVLAIRLDNPLESSRWYPGAGIYRNVWLLQTGLIHIGQWGTQVSTSLQDSSGIVSVATTLKNETTREKTLTLLSTVFDSDANQVAVHEAQVILQADESQVAHAQFTVASPRIWSLEDPHCYTLISQLVRDGQVLDRYETSFGIRTIRWDAQQGFFLNDKHVPLQGVCLHHDLGALGAAINPHALQRQIEIMQEMGVNAIRTAHNPPAPEFLDLCDQMGVLVMCEFSDTWKIAKKPNGYATLFEEWAEKDVRALVRRDRNHPCVIAWSTGNEIGEQLEGKDVSQFLTDIVHSEDLTRPATTGNDQIPSGYNGFQETVDVFGYNYKPAQYSKFHAANPKIPLYGSETSSTISSRGEYFFPVNGDPDDCKSGFQISSYDLYAPPWATTPEREFQGQDENPFVAGEFVWTGFDYLGEPSPYTTDTTVLTNFHDDQSRAKAAQELEAMGKILVPSRSSYFGIVDLAGFKKDRFYLYQSRWRPDLPMAHILPHWNWPERLGEVTPVHVYTSGDEAELFLNGRSLGRQQKEMFQYRLRWDDVVYQPGELRVISYKAGERWVESSVRTTGPAARVRLETNRDTINADGEDLVFVTASIVDEHNQQVPRSKHRLQFVISGPGEILATDNGDATDHTSFQSSERNAYNGLALVIVRSLGAQPGVITLTASSEGLTTAQINVKQAKDVKLHF